MSGDVDLNLIDQKKVEEILLTVDNKPFEVDDWNTVVIECKSLAAKWEQLSIYLGLSFEVTDNIKGSGDNYHCWSEALKQWIKQNYNTEKFGVPSWRSLLNAITQVDRLQFKKLAAEHQAAADETCQTSNENAKPTFGETSHKVVIAGVAPDLVVATAKSHLTTATLSRTQNEQLYQRRCIDSQDMVYKFQELFTATKKSLRDTKVSVTELVGHLECLGSIKPTFKDAGLLPLRRQLPGLANAETIDAVMSVVKDYCSFFNYHMLEHIINEFGTKQDKRNLASYIEDFTKYAERCITQCPSEVGKMNEEGYANLLVTLDDSFDNCAVSHLNVFIGNLRKILNIPSNVDLRLCHINLGSIKLIFQIPLFVQQAIFPLSSDQEAELSSLAGVVQLSCGDYQFTRHQTKEGGEESTSDSGSESGQIDREESMASKNTHTDTELAYMGAGLAMGKSEDNLSIADSALGRSSVITDATAGVTQFSEDLFDREYVCDLADMGMGHIVAGASSDGELHLASCRGDIVEIKRLIEEKQLNPLHNVGMHGVNALHYAARFGQLDVLKYFIEERGCNPASQDYRAATPLHYAAAWNHLHIVHYLVAELQMDPLCFTDDGTTPLHTASEGGDINVVRYLVKELSKFLPLEKVVTSRGMNGRAPIHFTSLYGHLEVVKYFITVLNCDPNIATSVEYKGRTTTYGGRTALHAAAQRGHLHVIKYLVEQCDCNPSHLDNERVTPLHMAAQQGHLDVVKYLTLEQHCDPLCINKKNNTPLHDAAREGRLEVVKFYIDILHCLPDIRGWNNQTPLERAHSQGHHHVVKYLESIHPKFK